jgi:hypothetical protein
VIHTRWPHHEMITALRWQIDLDFPHGRTWGLICVQRFPVELNGLPGPGGQVVYRTPCNQNGRKLWHVAAIPVAVPFDDQRVRSDHLVGLLDTSLAQNGAICARPNVVGKESRQLPRFFLGFGEDAHSGARGL